MRIRTPRVRPASTKPAAAIVFPDAVGWRKRKRRTAPGSSPWNSASSGSSSSAPARPSSSSGSSSCSASGSAACPLPLPFVSAAVSSWSAISSVSIPASASTWWRRSSVPDASAGVSWPSTRSSPSMRPQSTFHRGDGAASPASISASAASSARRRAVPGARPVAGSSLGRRNGSPAQPSARWAASARAASASGVIVDCSVVACIAAAPGGAAVPTEEMRRPRYSTPECERASAA